jgi:maltose/moltooligosaccharide transporter
MTGLIIQPIIGYFSDRTWTKLGRRKPYLLARYFSFCRFILNAQFCIMDCSRYVYGRPINVSMEPFALSLEIVPENQRTMGFAMQSFIGIGAYFASKLP